MKDKKNEYAKVKQMWQHYVKCPQGCFLIFFSKYKPLNKHSTRCHLFCQAQQLHDFLSIHSTTLGENFQVQNELMVRNNYYKS
jgi:hypothetical protein